MTLFSNNSYDNGKPVEKRRRKAKGAKADKYRYASQLPNTTV
jgi:hypothetical protein